MEPVAINKAGIRMEWSQLLSTGQGLEQNGDGRWVLAWVGSRKRAEVEKRKKGHRERDHRKKMKVD